MTAAVLVVGGCSFESSRDHSPGYSPIDAGDGRVIDLETGAEADTPQPPNRLCGSTTACNPDEPAYCVSKPVDSGTAETDADADAGKLACRVVHSGDTPHAQCAPAGDLPENEFCNSDAECGPGLACAGDRCLKYCCGAIPPLTSSDVCDREHYCTGLPLAERRNHKVPVCVGLDHCVLLKDDGGCIRGKSTCSVVRNDGATTCVPIGPQKNCEDCSNKWCQAGLVCLGPAESRRCRTLCSIGDDSKCMGGHCEGLSSIPKKFGICSVNAEAGCGI